MSASPPSPGDREELARMRAALIDALHAEERLGAELRLERRRSERLATHVDRLQRSESFRVGRFLVRVALTAQRPRTLFRRARREAPRLKPRGEARLLARSSAGSPMPTIFVVWGVPAQRTEGALDRITQLQTTLVDVEPLLVTDAADLEPFRRHGYPVEHVLGLEAWARHRPAASWGRYVAERMAEVLADHRSERVVVFGDMASDPSLRGVLHALLLPRLAGPEDNLLPSRA